MLYNIGDRVTVKATGEKGTVVAGTMWTNNENDPGDRVVKMDNSGERLVFESFLLTPITIRPNTVEYVVNWMDENIDNLTIQNEDYATMIRNFGWDLAFIAIGVKHGENVRDDIDKKYSRYIMGM
jgi:hypothetical protein